MTENEKVIVTHVMFVGGGVVHVRGARAEVRDTINRSWYEGLKLVELMVQSVDGFDACSINVDRIFMVMDDHSVDEEPVPTLALPPKDVSFVKKAENTTEVVL